MRPEPPRRGSGTNAPSSSGHNVAETIQVRATEGGNGWLCRELRNINRWNKNHNPEQSALNPLPAKSLSNELVLSKLVTLLE